MIRKLRIRFVLAAMIAFFLVIALMGSLVNIINYIVVTKRNDQTGRSLFRKNRKKDVATPMASPGSRARVR